MTTRSQWRRWVGGLAAAGAAALMIAVPAAPAAADASNDQWTSGPPYCNLTQANLSLSASPPDYLVVQGVNSSHQPVAGPDCDYSGAYQPVAHMAVRWELHYLTGGDWIVCRQSGWKRATDTAYLYDSVSYGTPPCGATYYRTVAYGARYDAGAWHGNVAVVSDSMYYGGPS